MRVRATARGARHEQSLTDRGVKGGAEPVQGSGPLVSCTLLWRATSLLFG
jgi:hypothetical protein